MSSVTYPIMLWYHSLDPNEPVHHHLVLCLIQSSCVYDRIPIHLNDSIILTCINYYHDSWYQPIEAMTISYDMICETYTFDEKFLKQCLCSTTNCSLIFRPTIDIYHTTPHLSDHHLDAWKRRSNEYMVKTYFR
jgi:hypothetical protein